MTHHTRQSALGLPYILTKTYGGKEYSVSNYTMSEIIGSMYDMMEETGVREGILFLDEINCVSETLAPSMLQFLQYKMFGRHRVPDGWIVVTAGNPPEYNNSVREFDTVTWDRVKRIDIEPDYRIWKEYAMDRGVHPSISTYLDIKTNDFYRIESTVDGKTIVTARAWLNLSDMIRLYEKNNIAVDEKMVGQYLQDKKTARSFANYYDLFRKYRADYQIDDILSGKASNSVRMRAAEAGYDEKPWHCPAKILNIVPFWFIQNAPCRRKACNCRQASPCPGRRGTLVRLRPGRLPGGRSPHDSRSPLLHV